MRPTGNEHRVVTDNMGDAPGVTTSLHVFCVLESFHIYKVKKLNKISKLCFSKTQLCVYTNNKHLEKYNIQNGTTDNSSKSMFLFCRNKFKKR
jgi:hypothetical protein